jgi:uncharacterized protein YigA (DUF484 family)
MTNPQVKLDPKSRDRGAPDEAQVAAYLADHPDFFDRHATLLASLRLPHARGDGSTVSLLERQVDVLRERTREAELRLRTLVDNGHANDALAAKIHRLASRLVHGRDAKLRLAAIEASLRQDFGAREFVIVLTRKDPVLAGIEARCLRFVAAEDAGLRSFESLFASGKPRCGRIRDSQRDYLFPAVEFAVGSVALVPLGSDGVQGLLAIASPDADHFNPTMSTEFLARIGELIAIALDGSRDPAPG